MSLHSRGDHNITWSVIYNCSFSYSWKAFASWNAFYTASI